MNSSKFAFVVVLACMSVSSVVGSFQANFTIWNDPAVHGRIHGFMYWEDPSVNGGRLRNEYVLGPIEIILESSEIRYLHCSSTCEASFWVNPFPLYQKLSSDVAITGTNATISVNGRTCSGWSRNPAPSSSSSKTVRQVWIDGSSAICRALYVDGTYVDFPVVTNSLPSNSDSLFTAYTGWNCPSQSCSQIVDYMLVFDESGSITDDEFNDEQQFAINLASSYSFGSTSGIGMGLVMFDDVARLICTIQYNQQNFINNVEGVIQDGGDTCIGCGIKLAQAQFTSSADRSAAPNIMILLTDGQNNRPYNPYSSNYYTNAAAAAKAAGTTIISVGVGSDYDYSELVEIASSPDLVFTTDSFSDLQSVLDEIIQATCTVNYNGSPCTSCYGYCSCGAQCLCPDDCSDGKYCTTDSCKVGSNGNGCTSTQNSCVDGNACTQDGVCSESAQGCVYNNITCSGANACNTVSCDPSSGCQTITKSCEDGNACTGTSCDTSTGCLYEPVYCNLCSNVTTPCPTIACEINECNPSTGKCDNPQPVVCNDNSECTTDACDSSQDKCVYTAISCDDGNPCTDDSCDVNSGCQNIYFDDSVRCDDGNACTDDSCDSTLGCVNLPKTCPDDGDVCTIEPCDPLSGCVGPQPLDCASEPNIAPYIGDCQTANCNNVSGCELIPNPGAKLDACGYCEGSGQFCVLGLTTTTAAVVGTGVLIAIIVGAVAIAAALGAFTSKKAYDLWMKNKNNMTGAQNNPMYADNGLSGNNPFYNEEMK